MALPLRAPARPGAPAASSAGKPAAPKPAAATAVVRKLKKGELLFAEGENSRAMYFLKSGMIRLFKKKGDSIIELDTVHSGTVLGELAFLDGNPRSASGEALTDCELTEVSGPMFQETLGKMPEWLKIMLKTVVGRLRTASTRIRQLETASTSFDYSEKDGKRSAHYTYLSPTDVMKIGTALLLVASRNGQAVAGKGTEAKMPLVIRYANQIMGVPAAKVTSLIDIFTEVEITATAEESKVLVRDVNFLEQLISYLNEENLLEPSKRHDLPSRGFVIMSLMVKHLASYKKDEKTGLTVVNVAEIAAKEKAATGKDPFRIEEFQQLTKLNYASNLNIKSQTEACTTIETDKFMQAYRLQRAIMAINVLNEQKRGQAR